ncbi:MAG: hypothetical protein ACOYY2_02985 [Actinomycetota bacterium]
MSAAVVLRCLNAGCRQFERVWTLPLAERAPGLVEVPHLVCADCGAEPIREVVLPR